MNLADHTQDEYQKILYLLQKNIQDDRGARSQENAECHCEWIHRTFASDNKTLKILDMGCGIGLYSKALAKRGHRVVGVDISPYVIEHAKQSLDLTNCTFIIDNILNFKWASSFDLVIFTYSIFNTFSRNDAKKLLYNVASLLNVGGNFYFEALQPIKEMEITSDIRISSQDPHDPLYPESEMLISDQEWDQVTQSLKCIRYNIINARTVKKSTLNIYYYSLEDYKNILTETGFTDIQFIPSPPGTLDNDYLPYISITAKRSF